MRQASRSAGLRPLWQAGCNAPSSSGTPCSTWTWRHTSSLQVNSAGLKRYGGHTTVRKPTGTPTASSGSLSRASLPRLPGAADPDGLEVDGVFTGERFRNRGYAHKAVQALVSACGGTTLYMHSTVPLVAFYSSFGFTPISERELPEATGTVRFCRWQSRGCKRGTHAAPATGLTGEMDHPGRGRISISIVLIFS